MFGKIEGKEGYDIIKLMFICDRCILLDIILLIKIFFFEFICIFWINDN